MKATNKVASKVVGRKAIVLGSALLGICTTIGFANPVQAAPHDDTACQHRSDDRDNQDKRNAKRDDKNDRHSAQKDQRGDRKDQRPSVVEQRDNRQRDNRRGLTTGDVVRVNGVQQDRNDIRNARVSLLRNC